LFKKKKKNCLLLLNHSDYLFYVFLHSFVLQSLLGEWHTGNTVCTSGASAGHKLSKGAGLDSMVTWSLYMNRKAQKDIRLPYSSCPISLFSHACSSLGWITGLIQLRIKAVKMTWSVLTYRLY